MDKNKKKYKFIKKLFSGDPSISFKRWGTLYIIILISVITISNLFWELNVAENIFTGLVTIVVAGFGGMAIENVSNRIGEYKTDRDDKDRIAEQEKDQNEHINE